MVSTIVPICKSIRDAIIDTQASQDIAFKGEHQSEYDFARSDEQIPQTDAHETRARDYSLHTRQN
jgi:hypothetical protein